MKHTKNTNKDKGGIEMKCIYCNSKEVVEFDNYVDWYICLKCLNAFKNI